MRITTWTARLAAAAGAIALPALLLAQVGQTRITTYGGVYTPANTISDYSVAGGGASANFNLKHKAGFVLGANAMHWVNPRFGFEGSAGYGWSDLKANFSGTTGQAFAFSGSQTAHVLLGNAKLLLGITPPDANAFIYAGIGPAIIARGGDAYKLSSTEKLDGLTDLGGVLAVNARVKLTDFIGLKLGVDSYLYSASLKYRDSADPTNNFDFGSRFQSDFVVSAGLSFALNR